MANALHNYESLKERRDALKEIEQSLTASMALLKKKRIDVLEIGNDKMVPDSIDRLQKFADETATRIKRWSPPAAPPMAEPLRTNRN